MKYSLIDYHFNHKRFVKIRLYCKPGFVWDSSCFPQIKYYVQARLFDGQGVGEQGFNMMKIEVVNQISENRDYCYYNQCKSPIISRSNILCSACKVAVYCSRLCAKRDWNGICGLHRDICRK